MVSLVALVGRYSRPQDHVLIITKKCEKVNIFVVKESLIRQGSLQSRH
jgi:hypothetical protein